MSTWRSKLTSKQWTQDNYLISTDPSLIPVTELNKFFSTDDAYWAITLPEADLLETIQNSLCFAMYHQKVAGDVEGQEFIGFARCVTDFTTLLYLTDVYTKPAYRGKQLGSWLITCVQETIDSMPFLRRSMLITSDWDRSVPFYQKLMGMSLMQGHRLQPGESGDGTAVMTKTGPGWPEH